MEAYVEPGGSWLRFWAVAGALGLVLGLVAAVLPDGDVPPLLWPGAVGAVLGIVGSSTYSARRLWTVRVAGGALVVGRERVPLADIDERHLRSVDSGVDAGAPVLGGGWSVPQGRTGLPLRLADGRTVLVPTQDPAALRAALLAAKGTLEP